MFRVREGLKLARAAAFHSPKVFSSIAFSRMRVRNFGWVQKFSVFNPACFAGFLDGGEIDVRSQILFAGIGQQIVG